ncbi:MAG TPA: protein-L-isoaspartate(D-aspartate) O-methyltransferase [Terriglobales bacterium]|nr:protein-L-isoaspartate(D-aspartate) O-methyltransferase [Terriglobales bacterium]
MAPATQTEAFAADRQNMVDLQLRARGISDQRVLQAMAKVPRHEFVPENFRSQAYEDHPLPIGEGQTVSQPYIVALMLEVLALSPSDKVLEVGTGSGYVAALLGQLAAEVYSVERFPELAQEAADRLLRLGCTNVKVLVGDGSAGLPSHAPFDAILVSAAAPQIPPALIAQLRSGGRMVIPVGPPNVQELQLVRNQEGEVTIQRLEGCCFVPLIGSHGYPA